MRNNANTPRAGLGLRICLLLGLLVCLQSLVPLHAADWQYRVRPGDTLWDLAAKHMKQDVSWQQLQAHNRIADPHVLPPGTRLRFPVQWLRVRPRAAVVAALHGPVTVRMKPGAPMVAAAQGMRLGIDAVLETGEDASVTVQFADGSRTLVMSGSRVAFDRLSAFGETGMVDTRMRLQRGRTSNKVTPARGPASRFIIETPSATTSVRGTRFRVASTDASQDALTEVLEGRVAVQSGRAQIELPAGFGANAAPAANAGLRRHALLPPPELAATSLAAQQAREVSWAPLAGAMRYRILVAKGGETDALAFETTTEARSVALATLPPGDYVVAVRGIAASGLEGADALQALHVPVAPPAPLALRIADENGHVTTARPKFSWAQVEQAHSYRVQVAPEPGFDALTIDAQDITGTRFRPNAGLAPGIIYQWRVGARDAEGNLGPYSRAERFEVVPSAPRDLSIARTARVLSWQPIEEAGHYRVQVARKQDFSDPVIDRVVDAPRLDLQGLRSGKWHVRVQAVADDGEAEPFEATQTIDVPCRWCKLATVAAVILLVL